jgi:hypothetical protein
MRDGIMPDKPRLGVAPIPGNGGRHAEELPHHGNVVFAVLKF